MLFAYIPSFAASFSKAAELYHPGEAVLPSVGGFSKKMTIVYAFEPNALVILDANPNPVEAPITKTRFGPSIWPLDFIYWI